MKKLLLGCLVMGMAGAMAAGVDHFDVAPAYGKDGECEIKMGEALKGIPRDTYSLAHGTGAACRGPGISKT